MSNYELWDFTCPVCGTQTDINPFDDDVFCIHCNTQLQMKTKHYLEEEDNEV